MGCHRVPASRHLEARRRAADTRLWPGKSNQNAYIERFNRSVRNDVLNLYLFRHLDEVREIVSQWMIQHDEQRPPDALSGLPPTVYATRMLENCGSELSA